MSDSNRVAQFELTRLDRSFGSKSPTLYNMPINIVNLVLEKLEPMDRLRIRKVCRNFRTCVDKFGIHFFEIRFFLRENCFMLVLDGIRVDYTNTDNGGSTVQYVKKKKVIEGESSMKVALRDLKTVLKYTSKLKLYSIQNNKYEIIKSFDDVLKSKKCIHVKRITLEDFSFSDVVTILQYFDTKVLESIESYSTGRIIPFESITCLDQWKCAKYVSLCESVLENRHIEHLFHFRLFDIKLDDFPIHIAFKIRDDLLRRNTFQSCRIKCDTSKSNPIEIAKVFEPDYAGGNEFSIEYSTDNATFEINFYSSTSLFSLGLSIKIVKKNV